MTNHFSDDDLILLHYGELSAAETAAATHLGECDDCRARLESLRRVFALVDDEAIPEPAADYEQHVWRHVSWRMRPSRRRVWLSTAAAAALLVIGFFGGQLYRRVEAPYIVTTDTNPAVESSADDRLAYAAESHLDRSSRLLLDVANGEDVHADQSATELVATNRLYRVMAERAGASDVAALLDELEPILLELEHGGDPAAIRKRIEERELLFKLRVLRTRVGEKPARTAAPSRKGIDS